MSYDYDPFSSRLVQRLNKPRGEINPFSFGGGYKNGGLSDEASGLISQVWDFDYMGAAEFEFGAVPKALQKLAECTTGKLKKRSGLLPFTIGDFAKPIFVLCRPEHSEDVTKRIRSWAVTSFTEGGEFPTKEDVRLSRALATTGEEEYPRRTVGWLELDNGYFFTIDREMFDNTCAIFGVKADLETNA